jgi:hypothetical protein
MLVANDFWSMTGQDRFMALNTFFEAFRPDRRVRPGFDPGGESQALNRSRTSE